jgi:lipoprotein-anchoring transpeptidase ErfK/SrfK
VREAYGKFDFLTVTPKTEPKAVIPSIEAKSTTACPESKSAGAGTVANLINIDKTNQTLTDFLDGVETYDWPVSTGKTGYSTPSGTYSATSMNEIWYSKQWGNAPMPHSIFFVKDGHAIHGSNDVKNAQQSALAAAGAERDLGKPASNGCVRLLPENAATIYMRNSTQSG